MSVITWKPQSQRRGSRPAPAPDGTMPLVGHLSEFRDRLVRCAIGVTATTLLAFLFVNPIMGLLLDLAGNHTIQAIDPTETFGTYFKVAFTAGLGLAMPLLVYQLLRFLAPGLTRGENRALYMSLPFVVLCFVTGALFCYLVILPSALNFLLSFGDPRIVKQISLTKFIGFVSNFMLAVGAAFELPVVIFMLAKLGVVTYQRLAKFRKYAFLLSFVVAAMITPTPDPLNQGLVAIPLFLLYELGLQLSRFARKSPVVQ
ncbi:MAG TPA: twin-arginine translocase subunit TatC [Chloroflexia bacterium]|nr:twin-arginine translocase subunit TatC [Chloroflexia bacterium]